MINKTTLRDLEILREDKKRINIDVGALENIVTNKQYKMDRLRGELNGAKYKLQQVNEKIKKLEKGEKLKTLKDLDDMWIEHYGLILIPRINGQNCLVRDIKKEAIEWIKELNDRDTEEPEEGFGATEYGSRANVIKWIKHFFNISEEDLKEW